MTNDMRGVIVPKSDQWNFDDFQAGPMTFTVTGVKVKAGQEQPVEMSLEGTQKFFRPCKSMARVLVAAWGADSSKYVGRSMTLYGDPKVKWGGMEVGGIRISHMSHIDESMTMALTVTRANKKPYTVKPLVVAKNAAPQSQPVTGALPASGSAEAAPYSEQIKSAKTLDELGAVWKSIPKDDKEMFVAAKDARKAELSAPKPEAQDDGGILAMKDDTL